MFNSGHGIKRRILFLLPFLLLMACSSNPELEKPVVASFTSEKTTVTPGESVTLRWSGVTTGATLTLSPGFMDVTGKSFMVVTPAETTNYTLQVSNKAGSQWYTQLVTVTPANPTTTNTAPIASEITKTTQLNTALPLQLVATDADGDTLRYTIVTLPSKGALTALNETTGEVVYTPQNDYVGTDTFSYKANDGKIDSAIATATITVEGTTPPNNTAPTANPQQVTLGKNTAIDLILTGGDAEQSALSFSIAQVPAHGTLSALDTTTGELTYTPTTDYVGSDSFRFSVSDGSLESITATVIINITDTGSSNTAPSAQSQTVTTNEDVTKTITLVASDANNDALTYIVLSDPAHGTLSGAAPTLTYTPSKDFNGDDSFTFKANDGQVDSASVSVSIKVLAVNDAPLANAQSRSVTQNGTLELILTGSDVDNTTLNFKLESQPRRGTLTNFDVATGTVMYTPVRNFSGGDSFTFSVSDGAASSSPATVSISVSSAANNAPTANAQTLSTNEDTALAVTLTGSDPEGSSLSYTVMTNPSQGTLTGTAPNLTYTPNANYFGTDSFTFKVNDGSKDSATAIISLTVNAVNDAPLAVNLTRTTSEDSSLNLSLSASDVENNSLTFSIVTNPTNGTLSNFNSATGAVTYTPNANYAGVDSFTYKVNDGTNDSTTATVILNVTSGNDAPVAAGQSITTDEDSSVIITLNASDADSDNLTYAVVSSPSHGTLSGTAPNLSYTPNSNYSGADSFTFKANDGTVDSDPATISISVNAVNDVPVANDLNKITSEDTLVAISLSGTDVDNDTLGYSIAAQPSNGTLSNFDSATGTLEYTPTANFTGGDSFTYQTSDGSSTSNTATVSIQVNNRNDAPIAESQTLSTNEDNSLNITLNGTDNDGDTLSYTLVTQPSHGTLSGTAPTLTYTPDANYNGADSFSFKAYDGTNDSNPASIDLTISAVNDAPIANAQNRSTQEDTAVTLFLTGSDADDDTLSFVLESQASNGTLSNFDAATGTVTYTPNTNYTGDDSFSFSVSDGTASSSPATVNINVGVANDAPVAASQTVTTDEDTNLAITLTASDTENDTLTYSIVNATTNGTLSGTAPNLTYTPNANYFGTDSFTFKVNDGSDDSATATISITVNAINDLPEASDMTVSTDEDVPLDITLSGFDVEGDALEYIIVTQPSNGALSGSYTYTPNANFNGTDSFTYKVHDSSGNSGIKTVTVNVNAVNDAPVATAATQATLEDTALNFDLSGSDIENDTLTFALADDATHGTVTVSSTGQVTYSPDENYSGTDSFTFIANDGSSDSLPTRISLIIDASNDAPVAQAQNVSTNEDTALNLTLAGTDVEGDALGYSILDTPLHGTLSGTAPDLTYTPNADYNGADSFTFKVNDGALESEVVTVSITVNPSNDKPVADAQSLTTTEDTDLAVTLTASDIDGDSLTYIIVNNPINGTLSGTAPNFTYTPDTNFNGSDSFTFNVNDSGLDSDTVTVNITVTPVSDTPVANVQDLSTNEDTDLIITLTGSDADGDSLTYRIATNPMQGTLAGTAPNLTYTPNADFNGSDSFSFTVNDGGVDSAEATVSITVNPTNDLPTVSDESFTTNEDTAAMITLNASDLDSDTLTYTIVTAPSNGTLSGTAPDLTYTPKSNVNGSDSFTFKTNDGLSDSSLATVSITITPVNDKPVARWLELSMDEDSTLAVQLQATDAEGSSLTYSITSPENGGRLSSFSAANGTVTYTPASNFTGTDQFSYLANDGELNSSRVYVTITVNPVNDAPTATNSNVTTNEDTSKSITLSSSDVDGNTLSYTIMTSPSQGTLSGTAPNLTYTPTANYFGSDSFMFKVNDGTVDSATGTISITVSSINDKPTANAQSVTLDKNKSTSITLTGSDTENSSLTYTIVTNPSNGTLSGSGATRTYTPTTGYAGTDSFTFKVNDSTDDSSTATVSITVVEPLPPTINSFASSLTLASTTDSITFSWSVSSSDGDTVACTLNMGDGTSYSISDCVNTTSKTHTYSTTGFYTPTLTATDNDGSDSEKTYMTIDTFSSSSFDIHVVFVNDTMTSSQRAAFTTAATRWEKIITADKTGYPSGTRTCSGNSFTGTIDDLVIIATAPSIDGVGGTLGSAGPCATLNSLPLYGIMKFDIADIADLETDGDLNNVILHEMGHVLGIGSLWSNVNTTTHTYLGTKAISEYSTLKGSTQTSVPMENGGGSGTMDVHWEEDIFDNELMTGYLDAGRTNPLSRVTVGSLEDLGYTVNYSQADSYSLPAAFALRAPIKHIDVHSEPLGAPVELGGN